MVISKFLKSHISDKNEELVKQLQQEARMLFFDKMMYDINDALTSILAACDVEGKEAIPKIKQYIHRINQSLNNTKNFQSNIIGDKKFNVSIVLQNLIHVVKDRFKDAKYACIISDIKAPVQGDQYKFEKLLLYIFVSLSLNSGATESETLIELRQKDQDAMITILKGSFTFPEHVLEQINKIHSEADFRGTVQITPHGNGVEVIIKIPLQFHAVKISMPVIKIVHIPPRKVEEVQSEQQNTQTHKSWNNGNKFSLPDLAY